jgi:hypothetical protein
MTDAFGDSAAQATHSPGAAHGVPPEELDDADLLRQLEHLAATRVETLRHGSSDALEVHARRLAELEAEYLRRRPEREVDPDRLRSGARARTGADSPSG